MHRDARETHQETHTSITGCVTTQKIKFKRQSQTLYSGSLDSWIAGSSPSDLRFNPNYVILLPALRESVQRVEESSEKGLPSDKKPSP